MSAHTAIWTIKVVSGKYPTATVIHKMNNGLCECYTITMSICVDKAY